jgi:chromosome segregation ATPase
MKSSVQINDPAKETLNLWKALAEGLAVIDFVAKNPDFVKEIGQQVADATKLTQAEKDERDAAIAEVKESSDKLDALQRQYSDVQAQIAEARRLADLDMKAARDASDQYVKSAKETIGARWDKLDAYKKELDDREIAVADREADADKKENTNTAKQSDLSDKEAQLQKFADALRDFAPNVPVLEQASLTE